MGDVTVDAARGELVPVGDVELWVDRQGDPGAPAVLLIAGADSPGFRWAPTLVDALLAEGYQVVRFDHRDCGRSTRVAADAPYRLDDLVADTVGLLDRCGIGRAHVIGRSMGAMIGQLMAIDHAPRVASLTMFGTSPAPGDDELGGPDDEFVEVMAGRLFAGPPSDTERRVAWLVELDELLAGPRYPFDRELHERYARLELATGWATESGHGVAVHASPGRLGRLGHIVAPTLIVHGTADPVFPPAHARALARGIPQATLVEVEGLGHEVPDALVTELWAVLRSHLAAG